MALDGLMRVVGAGRLIAASVRQRGTDRPLVSSDQRHEAAPRKIEGRHVRGVHQTLAPVARVAPARLSTWSRAALSSGQVARAAAGRAVSTRSMPGVRR